MSRPKPPPPPRPDLGETNDALEDEATSSNPPPAPKPVPVKKSGPPPIPTRPDLEEEVPNGGPSGLKIAPPPVLAKSKSGSMRAKGRPEITIISAQPMGSVISPPAAVGTVTSKQTPPAPQAAPPVPQQPGTPINPFQDAPPILARPALLNFEQPTTDHQLTSSQTDLMQIASPTASQTFTPILQPSYQPTTPQQPSLLDEPIVTPPIPSPSESSSPKRPNRKTKRQTPPQRPKSKPVCELPVEGDPSPSKNTTLVMAMETIGEGGVVDNSHGKALDSKNIQQLNVSGQGNAEDSFVSGTTQASTIPTEKPRPVVPTARPIPNGGEETTTATNQAFPRLPPPPAKKPKPAVSAKPQVTRRPSLKQSPAQNQGTVEETPTQANPPKEKPTIMIPPKRKIVGSSTFFMDTNDDLPTVLSGNSDSLEQVDQSKKAAEEKSTEQSVPVKKKNKPTVIVAEKRKVPENVKTQEDFKIQEPNYAVQPVEDNQSSKPKKEPRLIRPKRNKPKGKDLSEGTAFDKTTETLKTDIVSTDVNRGSPEGESQEIPNKSKKKAPPRPGPPRPTPARPAPPRPTLTTKETAESKVDPQQGKNRARPKPPKPFESDTDKPRPATYGEERNEPGVDEGRVTTESPVKGKPLRPNAPVPKGLESGHLKKHTPKAQPPESSVVSSVQQTKIEPSAIALFDYESGADGDLTFQAGDEIALLQRVDKDWYVGRRGDKEGMMPVSFVEIIEDLPPDSKPVKQAPQPPSSGSSTEVIALYSFTGESEDELTMWAGDTIQLLEIVNDDWLKGSLNGKTGIFPSSYVELTPAIKSELMSKKHDTLGEKHQRDHSIPLANTVISGPSCKALYDYPGEAPDDLTFYQGDVIRLKERISDDWLRGEVHGMTGMFPAAFVEVLQDLPAESSTPLSDSHSLGTVQLPVTTALYEYQTNVPGDLAFAQGDHITIVARISDEWLEGMVDDRRGILPAAYVEPVDLSQLETHKKEEKPTSGLPKNKPKKFDNQSLLPRVEALFDFEGEEDDELSFKAGDTIALLSHINKEWMEGELNNSVGRFPAAFVDIIVDLPH
ncbi:SH3 domain-containing protein 19 [Nematostella vectensis]|uniref:SH3 domain-containing protein 19 n=1 Tax=Nematostella vectensis TaxID=45351 RepID=UPI0020778170|nr:SH3 domain-containing protein 19 [Nematostella vectensis]